MFFHPKRSNPCFQYTALGNSIAAGIGSSTNNYGYIHYFRDFLAARHRCVDLTNLANSGDTSSDLLRKLQDKASIRQAVKNANLITISIGGANLLRCGTDPECLAGAVATFASDWPQILHEIRKSIRSEARILVMNVYNPLTGENPTDYLFADNFIQRINNVIQSHKYRLTYQYRVVNVHDDFQGQFIDDRWKVCTWTHFCETPAQADPHPTDCGHLEIARLHELTYLNIPPIKNHWSKS